MITVKLEKVFRKLTLIFFVLFMIGLVTGFTLDKVFNIEINQQFISILAIIMIVFVGLSGILWNVFHLINKSKALAHLVISEKEELKAIGKSVIELPNDIKDNYVNTMKNDKIPLKDKILGTIFLIWFITTIILMILFWIWNNVKVEIILFIQFIVVFILAIIFGRRK